MGSRRPQGCKRHLGGVGLDCSECEPFRRSAAFAQWLPRLAEWQWFLTLTFDQRRKLPGRELPAQDDRGGVRPLGRGGLALAPRLADLPVPPRLDGRPLTRESAERRALAFLERAEEELGREVGAVVALEYHKNGWPHFHGLMHVQGGVRGHEKRVLGGLWMELAGASQIEPPRAARDVAAYVAKYLVKDLNRGDLVFWPRRGALARAWAAAR